MGAAAGVAGECERTRHVGSVSVAPVAPELAWIDVARGRVIASILIRLFYRYAESILGPRPPDPTPRSLWVVEKLLRSIS